jgi:hypothetical protein
VFRPIPPLRRLATVVIVAALVAATSCGEPRSRQPRRAPRTVASAVSEAAAGGLGRGEAVSFVAGPAGPTTVVDGAPMGYRQNRAGAKAAGVSFARLNESLVQMSEAAAGAAWRAMAAHSATEDLVADVVARLARVRRRWAPGELTYRVAPLAVRVTQAAPAAMRVEVWYVGVVAGANLASYEEWVTETYELVWERGDWRVLAFSEVPGPRPRPGAQEPTTAAEIEARLAGFEAAR